MTDFFISYTGADEGWAEWIGYVLEEAGFTVVIQAWDFQPGSNFILEMQRAASEADRTIMVLSPDYMKSHFARPEWAAAFASDPEGLQRKLIPVMARACQVSGILKPLVHINLVGASEDDARSRLLAGMQAKRAKPATRPSFPGSAAHGQKPFPGASPHSVRTATTPYMPKIRRAASDLEKRRFLKSALIVIAEHFKEGANALEKNPHVDGELAVGTAEITAEFYVDGGNKAVCRIWIGDAFGENAICYFEGRRLSFSGSSCNELLAVVDDGRDLTLNATMDIGIGFGGSKLPFETSKMTPEQAAEYLWRRFVAHLEY